MAPPSDTTLLLRVHAEHQWLHSELIPVLDQLEDPAGVPDGEASAAVAYLEFTWTEARRRAQETDAAHERVSGDSTWDPTTTVLVGEARRYYGWLRDLRKRCTSRVEAQLGRLGADGASAAA